MAGATEAELAEVPGIGPQLAASVVAALRRGRDNGGTGETG
jgi:DNA uptake protein ComE-like DNA-binding protein